MGTDHIGLLRQAHRLRKKTDGAQKPLLYCAKFVNRPCFFRLQDMLYRPLRLTVSKRDLLTVNREKRA